jgi:hypothetical protein
MVFASPYETEKIILQSGAGAPVGGSRQKKLSLLTIWNARSSAAFDVPCRTYRRLPVVHP